MPIETLADLGAYFRRIGYTGPLTPTRATLDAIHLAHATHIPFENLDILLGKPIRLDLSSLEAKLVRGNRGGYCFEQNRLLGVVLASLGFAVTPLSARVRFRATSVLPRTHMLLRVDVEGVSVIADVGFGSAGLLVPLALAGGEATQFRWRYRIVREGDLFVLQSGRDEWLDLYAFTMERQEQVDFEMASYFVSTHPESRFVLTMTVQRSTPELREIIRNDEWTTDHGDRIEQQQIEGAEHLLWVLAERFGLVFPPGTRFCGNTIK